MENKNAIYNEDVERIVNDPERQARLNAFHVARAERKQRKLIETSFVYFFFSLLFAICGIFGWMANWICYPVIACCSLYGAFCAGRFFENGKITGWK